MARYIFITGGVVSSLGKGLMAASLAALLQARGYSVRIRKFDANDISLNDIFLSQTGGSADVQVQGEAA